MKKAGVLDNKTKNELFTNQLKLKKTKEFATEIGLDANEGHFGRHKEFENDKRFQELFDKKHKMQD